MSPKPNILLINTHDTGRHLGCYGVRSVHTPNLDRLASEGVRFSNYFATSTLCSPSRGAAMTGRYPQRNGMMGLCHGAHAWRLNDGEKHLSHLLHDAGYHTRLIGHQHETTDVAGQLCFDEYGDDFYPGTWEHIHGEDVAAQGSAFLTGQAAKRSPFYLQLGFFETHRPFGFGDVQRDDSGGVFVPPYLKDTPEARSELALFQGNVRKMDECVGAVLAVLKDSGLEANTLVIFTTDHGIDFPRAKTTLYDPGMGIPLLVRWPSRGVTGGTTCEWLLGNVDLLSTILDLAGLEKPDNLDGTSFVSAFDDGAPIRECQYAMMTRHGGGSEIRSVRTGRYKLIRNFEPRSEPVPPVVYGDGNKYTGANKDRVVPPIELFDLEKDPNEFTNLADDDAYSKVRRELETRLWSWMEQVDDPVLKGPVPTPYYLKTMQQYREWKEQAA